MMLLLAIETSTPRSSVALVDRDGPLATATLGVPRRHGEFLGPAVAFCLQQAGREAAAVTGVVVGLGPGLYTGLRVGIAFGQAFAQARRLPVVGLSGLDVLAFTMRHSPRPIFAAIDARRSQVFWARYDRVPGGVQRDGDLHVGSPDELIGDIMSVGRDVLVVGNGVETHHERYQQAGLDLDDVSERLPLAEDLAALALPRFVREETSRPGELRPVYLRRADAKIGWETRGRMQGGAAPVPEVAP